MPQFRPKAMLERSAAADLAKNTLSRIPTLFGRLVYLASVRDPNSGIYRHYGLASLFGREETRLAFQFHHEAVFQEWLRWSLADKRDDLASFLEEIEQNGLKEDGMGAGGSNGGPVEPRRQAVLDHWSRVRAYRAYIPASARESERELFFAEVEVLIDALRCDSSSARS